MRIKQVFAYLEENLKPENGGKVQFIEEPEFKREIIKIFIFDNRFFNYKYIFSFVREEVKGKGTFSCYVKSGFSGIDHKLEIPFVDEMYYDIKEGLKGIDARYMKSLEDEVNACVVPEDLSVSEQYTEADEELNSEVPISE